MKVIDFIKEYGVAALKEQLFINVKEYDDLIVLNYDQINSPKAHSVVMECRGLILDKHTLDVVCRGFDRFFNIGECPETQQGLDLKECSVYEKVDGSLIKIYNYKDKWHISTRGTAFAESEVNGFGITFKELVLKVIDMSDEQFQQALSCVDEHLTFICEVVSFENRVVKAYAEPALYLLAARWRDECDGMYSICSEDWFKNIPHKLPKKYDFGSIEDCVDASKELKDLDEGYVVYDKYGVPRCKIKSPAYLAVHRIKGEGLTPKRIMELVLINEQDEYLTYFPEHKQMFEPYISAYVNMMIDTALFFHEVCGIENQKEFAMKVKDHLCSSVLFKARRDNISVAKAFQSQSDSYKMSVLEKRVAEDKCK